MGRNVLAAGAGEITIGKEKVKIPGRMKGGTPPPLFAAAAGGAAKFRIPSAYPFSTGISQCQCLVQTPQRGGQGV